MIADVRSRNSQIERKRYYEIARGSQFEVDAVLNTAADLNYCIQKSLKIKRETMIKCLKYLSGLINSDTA